MFSTKGFPVCRNKWANVFKSGLSKFCGSQPLKNLKGYGVQQVETTRKLITKYLSSVCLSKEEMHAILALPGNIPLLKQLLIAMANALVKTFADSFISFGGILSIPFDL